MVRVLPFWSILGSNRGLRERPGDNCSSKFMVRPSMPWKESYIVLVPALNGYERVTIISDAAESEALAQSVPDAGDVFLCLPLPARDTLVECLSSGRDCGYTRAPSESILCELH